MNIAKHKFARILLSWGFEIIGPPPQDHHIDFLIIAHRAYGIERRVFMSYPEFSFTNWPESDHRLAWGYQTSIMITKKKECTNSKFWSFFRHATVDVLIMLETRIKSVMPATPDPATWPAVKAKILSAAQDVRREVCATRRNTVSKLHCKVQRLQGTIANPNTPAFDRSRIRRTLRKTLVQLIDYQRSWNSPTSPPFNPRAYFIKIISQISLLDKESSSCRWSDHISAADMQEGWRSAFYREGGQDCHFDRSSYARYPVIPSPLDLQEYLSHLRTGRTPGPDQLSNECYRLFPSLFAPFLTSYWRALADGTMPPDHSPLQSNIAMIYKKKGEKSDPGNYRPISLLNIDVKLFSSYLNKGALEYATKWFGDEQQGFLPGRWIQYNLRFVLDLLHGLHYKKFIHNTSIEAEGLLMLFIDFKKAFDTVRWDYLARIVAARDKQCPELMMVMESLYKQHTANIMGGESPTPINVNTGVKQGDCASPLLFNLALEDLLTRIRTANTRGLVISKHNIKSVAYADDTTLLSTMRHALTTIDIVNSWSAESGVYINYRKTDGILVSPENATANQLHDILATLRSLQINIHVWNKSRNAELGTYLGIPINTFPAVTQSKCNSMLLTRLQVAAGRSIRARTYAATNVLQRSQIATTMISSIPIYFLGAVPPNSSLIHDWQRVVTNFIFGKRHMRPSNATATLPATEGGIQLWIPQIVDESISLYVAQKMFTSTTPSWVLAPMMLCLQKQLTLDKWWMHVWKICRKYDLASPWHRPTCDLVEQVRQRLIALSHDDIHTLVRKRNKSLPTPIPRIFSRSIQLPQSFDEWWSLPLPARVLDFGWFTIHGRNHGGANSLVNHDKWCHHCNRTTRSRWHWGQHCKYHDAILSALRTHPHKKDWLTTPNIITMWGTHFLQGQHHLTRRSTDWIESSYALYLSWWMFNYTNECHPEQRPTRLATVESNLPQILRRLCHRDYQWILDITQDLLPQLYT